MSLISVKPTSFTTKSIYLVLFFAAAFLVLAYAIMLPAVKDIKEIRNTIVQQKIELENKIHRDKNMVQLNENIKKIEPELDHLEHIYVKNENKLEFITALEGIAKNHSIEQTLNLEIDKMTKKKNYGIMPISINGKGNYENLLKYLETLENLPFYFNVQNINLTINFAEGGGAIKIPKDATLSIQANTFWK